MNVQQPDLGQEVIDRLSRDYGSLGRAVAEYRKIANGLPDLTDKPSHDAYVDLIAKIRSSYKHIESVRVQEKDPYLRQERAVDGFFSPVLIALEKLGKSLSSSVTDYLKKIEAEERRVREAAAAAARVEAERLRREQEEAERRARETARKAAEAQALEDRLARRAVEAAAAQAAAAQRAAADAEAHAMAARAAAEVHPADLARTRSDVGTLSTLQTVWTFEVEDYDIIPLDQLRAYIPREIIDKALRQAVKIGVRKLPGVRFFETSKAMIR